MRADVVTCVDPQIAVFIYLGVVFVQRHGVGTATAGFAQADLGLLCHSAIEIENDRKLHAVKLLCRLLQTVCIQTNVKASVLGNDDRVFVECVS